MFMLVKLHQHNMFGNFFLLCWYKNEQNEFESTKQTENISYGMHRCDLVLLMIQMKCQIKKTNGHASSCSHNEKITIGSI